MLHKPVCIAALFASGLTLVMGPVGHGAPADPTPGSVAPRSTLAPTLDLTLAPTLDVAGRANGIDVAYAFDAPLAATPGQPLTLRWNTLSPTPGRSTDIVSGLVVSDARGTMAIRRPDAAVGHDLLFIGDRAPVGTVRVRYHVPVADPAAPNGRGPHRELQAAGNGVATSGDGILLLPDMPGRIDVRLHWRLPEHATAVSSLGVGDVTSTRTTDEVLNGFYLAGPLRRFPAHPPGRGFSAYGLGSNDIDMDALFAWSGRDFEATRTAFGGSMDTVFRAFYRSYDGGPLDSGRADANGILLYIAPVHYEPDAVRSLKRLMAHEMIHVFQPKLEDSDDNLWFGEGSADYLALRIPFDAGLMPIDDYLANINAVAASYYGNARRNIANDAIGAEFWKSADSWTVPYSRGALYFADLDARVRAKSGGRVTLVTLMRELAGRARHGQPHGAAQWRAIVVRHAGTAGGLAFDAMLAGRTIFPVAGAFGRCVIPEPVMNGVFDLLYTKLPKTNVVATVTQDSNASRAGLRVGDRITNTVLTKPAMEDATRTIRLAVERDGQAMVIDYLPRKGTVDARRWTSTPGRRCQTTRGR